MKPFPGFRESERAFFRFIRDRAATEAVIKETALLLLGELEYLLLVDLANLTIEWSMEAGKTNFWFAVPLKGSGQASVYVMFDYDRGFYGCIGVSSDADARDRSAFIDLLVRERDVLGSLQARIDVGGTATLARPGLPLDKLDSQAVRQWRNGDMDLFVGRMFDPSQESFSSRAGLQELHQTLRSLIQTFTAGT